MSYYTYIVTCSDGTLYTGITNNIRRRIEEHNGVSWWRGAKYTRARRPVFLSHLEKYPDRSEAMKREWFIKHKMNRQEKLDLIKGTDKESILDAI